MWLICGNTQDRLVQELLTFPRSMAASMVSVEEDELFASLPFSFKRESLNTKGFLQLRGHRVELTDLCGVVLRLPRRWWPSQNFDLQDQMFVYHETIASWFATFSSLVCPVVNRFGLGWWLQDVNYPVELRNSLARVLNFPIKDSAETGDPTDRFRPTDRTTRLNIHSVYRSGGVMLPAPGCSTDLLANLTKQADQVSEWENRSGICLSRIDFEYFDCWHLRWIEVFPLLEQEPHHLIHGIASGIAQQLLDMQEVP